MYILEEYILKLLEFLTGIKDNDITIIRKHSRKLARLAELSFPLNIENWFHLVNQNKIKENRISDILEYSTEENERDVQIAKLKEKCKYFELNIHRVTINGGDVQVYLQRSSVLYKTVIIDVLSKNEMYGSCNIFNIGITVDCDYNEKSEITKMDLSTLRMLQLKDISSKLIAFNSERKSNVNSTITFTLNSANKSEKTILCGPVLNEKGVKSTITAEELFKKRTLDMRLMAQHRYKVQVVPNTPREDYFNRIVERLGRACITIEMLSNKPSKALKVTLTDLRTANRGAAFIFYNCARLSVLLKEFEKRVSKGIYPSLPDLNETDFTLLNQPEEWELFYVHILQFPLVVKSCIKDITKKMFNPQYLITFMSNFSSLFSAYYRRVRILTDPREHLFGVLFARIYLLKALQTVFHNALLLLNIEPIKEM